MRAVRLTRAAVVLSCDSFSPFRSSFQEEIQTEALKLFAREVVVDKAPLSDFLLGSLCSLQSTCTDGWLCFCEVHKSGAVYKDAELLHVCLESKSLSGQGAASLDLALGA